MASNTSVLKLPNGCNVKNSNGLRASYFLPVEENDWEGKAKWVWKLVIKQGSQSTILDASHASIWLCRSVSYNILCSLYGHFEMIEWPNQW